MRPAQTFLFFVAASLGASAAAATTCSFDTPAEITVPGVYLEARRAQAISAAPVGGLWWLEVFDDGDTGRCDRLEVRRRGEDFNVEGPLVDVEIVRRGPRSMAVRVPPDADVDDVFDARLICAAGNASVDNRLTVVGDVLAEAPAPVISIVDVSAFESTVPGCGFGAADFTRHRTFVDVVVDDPGRPLLLDAWLLPTGDGLPDESAERVTDAVALPPGQGALRLQVSTPGAFDLHLRLTDAETGVASSTVTTAISTPGGSGGGCAQTAPGAPNLVALVGLLAFLGLARPRQRQT